MVNKLFMVVLISGLFLGTSIIILTEVYAQGPPCPPACPDPPENIISIIAEQTGGAVILTFENEGVQPPQSFDIERDSGSGFEALQVLGRDVNRIVKNNENGNNVYEILDADNIQPSTTYTYQVVSKGQGQGNNVTSPPASVTTIAYKFDQDNIIKSKGRWIDTPINLLPLNDGDGNPNPNPPPRPIIYMPGFEWPLAQAIMDDSTPLITSSLNPQNEAFMIDLQPIPVPVTPFSDDDCIQELRIGTKRDSDSGQDLHYFVSIIENQQVTVHQYDFSANLLAKRVFNDSLVIKIEDQTLTDFDNLEVQIDIRGDFEANPANYRSLSVYYVDFFVPESDSYC